MNYANCNNCEPCYQQSMNPNACPYACCMPAQRDPIYPVQAERTVRRTVKVPKKTCPTSNKISVVKKKRVEKSPALSCEEACQEGSQKSVPHNTRNNSFAHPAGCCCPDCEKMNMKIPNDDCVGDIPKPRKSSKKKLVPKDSCSMMASSSTEKNMQNYLYDNPDLQQSKSKKSCGDLDDELEDECEVWLLQCPKDYDPKKLMNCDLGKLGKQTNEPKMECTTDRFSQKKTLAVIAPEKAAEYELICDNIKLVKPIGKITICEKGASKEPPARRQTQRKSIPEPCDNESPSNASNYCDDSDVDTDKPSDEDECMSSEPEEVKPPIAGKKMKKKLDDQRFTIETTVTVEKCGKKGAKKSMQTKCLPIVPPEPVPMKKMKKKSTKAENDNAWMDC